MEEKSCILPFSPILIYYVHQIKKRKRIMKILMFIAGSLFGAVCHAATLKFFQSCVDCSIAAFHTIVGML